MNKWQHDLTVNVFNDLQAIVGRINMKNGFRTESQRAIDSGDVQYMRRVQGNALMLIVGEVAEAHEEIRSGREPHERYESPDKPGKPEGVPSEIADVVIRCFDFAGAWGIDLGEAILEKIAYNETREHLHSRKF
jgi:NTP pyrophosphatase (non-canonical NTP hydrolase)